MKDWNYEMALAWKNYKPPTRPSKADLIVFRKFISNKIKEKGKKIKVLILGATPELRDIINEKGLTAYCVDYRKENFEALTTLKKRKKKDVLFEQDWKDMKLNDKYDLVFAEASVNTLEHHQLGKVLQSVKVVMKEDALFVNKTWLRFPKRNLSLKESVHLMRTKYKHLDFKFGMNLYNYSYLYDTKNNQVVLGNVYGSMKRFYERGLINKKEFESYCGLSYKNSSLALYFPLKREFESALKKVGFKIVDIIIPKPIGINKIPIYVLKK